MTRRPAFRVLVAVAMVGVAYVFRDTWPAAVLLLVMGVGVASKAWTTSNS